MTPIGSNRSESGFRLNVPSAGFDHQRDLVPGLLEFLEPLHKRFTPRQQELRALWTAASSTSTRRSLAARYCVGTPGSAGGP